MADSFTSDQVQGVLGRFKPVFNETVPPTANQVQGVLGRFTVVLDEAASATAPAGESYAFII